jgi:multidrug efflux pump
MNLSAPFIRRPVATTLLTIGLTLAGIVGFRLLPVASLPQVDFPTIQVSAGLPGASPETMATSVAAPLERQFGRIAGVTEMTSTSSLGSTSIVMQFDLDRDIDGAARDVQAAINAARGNLPANLPSNPSYRKVNPGDAPIFILALTSDSLNTGQLYDAASTILQQRLSRIEGVGQVFVGGSSLPAVRIDVDPTVLTQHGLDLSDVRHAIQATTLRRPKGQLAEGDRTWEIETNDQLRGAAQYRPVVISYASRAALRLSDVASVEDSVEDLRTAGFSNGEPAVLLVLFRSPGANILETVDRVREALPQLEAALPAQVHTSVVLDRTPPIRGSLRDVELTLVAAVILVTLVVFAFLRDLRAAAIPSVAVPVSLIGTFGAMYLCGYSLDNLSLMALTIATGFVVDDAIVVLENTSRWVEQGLSPREAALRGAREIGFTVLSMSVSLVAVFLPILLMGGMVGRLFREFAATLTIAIAISLVVSLTTTPMMCGILLRPRGAGDGTGAASPASARRGLGDRLYHGTGRALEAMNDGYRSSLGWALRHPRLMIAVTVLMIALDVALFAVVPKGFFPQQDNGRLTGAIQAAQDVSFQAMRQKLVDAVEVIRKDPAVENVLAFTGGGGGGGSAKNTARMFVTLKPRSERDVDADGVVARLRGPLSQLPGTPTFLQSVQDLRIGGRVSNAQFQLTLQAEETADLATWAPRLLARLRQAPGILDVSSDQQDRGLEATLVVDRDSASRLGVSAQQIDDALYDAFGQRQVAITYAAQNQYHVVMEVEPHFWQRPDTLQQIYVRSSTGAQVPLAAFTRWEPRPTSLAVNHQSQFPSVTISFNLAPGLSLGEAVELVKKTTAELGMPASVHTSFQGTAQAFEASVANEPILILAALVTVYIVLGVLYESTVHPITILSTLPSAGVGALLALMLCRTDLSVIALIGILLLIGIVKKNAILMIDFALEAERAHGKSSEDAIFEASLLRFRPILMTTMAALLGALPLAIGAGMGGELRRPLGIAIVGGLIVSQALTLYTTPVVYLVVDRLRLRVVAGTRRLRLRAAEAWRARRRVAPLALILLVVLASGCTVGPDYVRPTAPMTAAYKEDTGWKAAEPNAAIASTEWWTVYGDPGLDALEPRIQVGNQNLAAAEARFRQARALVGQARAAWYPQVSVGVSVTRSRQSSNLFGNLGGSGETVSDYAAPLSATWELDLWGRIRRTVESSEASAQASAADVAATRLSLQSELALDWFQLRTADAQEKLLSETVAAFEESLRIVRNRETQGIASGADVAQAETQLETTRAQLVDVGVARAQLEHAIAVLAGEPPASLSLPRNPLVQTPPAIPAGVPSELLERRPDVAANERRVAAANAEIGVAEAAYYPTVTLSATGGFEAGQFADWLTWPSRFWSVGPSASQTEQARAAYDATVAAYRQSVLGAFQEVEDDLAGLRILAREAGVQDVAVRSARESVQLTRNRYDQGTASYLDVVTAQAIALGNERTAVDLVGRRMASSVQLVAALGGGWSADRLPSADDLVASSGSSP